MRNLLRGLIVALLVLFPLAARAQSSIAGSVRDTSGAILPGATVEASSDALIEKTRSAVSDSAGQYRIVDLPPGTYYVVFSLSGFKTVRREGIVLQGTFAAQVHGELQVGALEETITVTGESPAVDVINNTAQFVANRDILDAIPTPIRNTPARALLLPGTTRDALRARSIHHERARLRLARTRSSRSTGFASTTCAAAGNTAGST